MAVYNDPVGKSSLKRKANGHADAPAPKMANIDGFVPRAPGERYQGTAARSLPSLRTVLKAKPKTPQKAQDRDVVNANAVSSLKKNEMVQQQRPKDASAIKIYEYSSMARKRDAEHDANDRVAKKQKLRALPSSDRKEAPSGVIMKEGHETKKAMPTNGHVPDTGRQYISSARDNSRSGFVGAVGNTSTDVPLKKRKQLSRLEQDTKNLNRNAPKPMVLDGVSVSRLCHSTLANDDVEGH